MTSYFSKQIDQPRACRGLSNTEVAWNRGVIFLHKISQSLAARAQDAGLYWGSQDERGFDGKDMLG